MMNKLEYKNDIVQDSNICSSGDNCAKAILANWGFSQSLTFEPDTFYEISYDLKKGTSDIGSRVAICANDDEGWCGEKYVSCAGAPREDGEWKKVTCTFISPENINNNPSLIVMLGSSGYDETNYQYIDNIVIKKSNRGGFSCELPQIFSASNNLEIGTFVGIEDEDYIMIVNRDTLNSVTTNIQLNAPEGTNILHITNLLTSEIKSVGFIQNKALLQINLDPGKGKLFKLNYDSCSYTKEICDNGVDDNCNGLIDGEESTCNCEQNDGYCINSEYSCGNNYLWDDLFCSSGPDGRSRHCCLSSPPQQKVLT